MPEHRRFRAWHILDRAQDTFCNPPEWPEPWSRPWWEGSITCGAIHSITHA